VSKGIQHISEASGSTQCFACEEIRIHCRVFHVVLTPAKEKSS
jgi:hypothetical protein